MLTHFLKNIFLAKDKVVNEIIYQLIDTYKDKNHDYIVKIKLINSPRGILTYKAKELVSSHRYILSKCSLDDTLTIVSLATNENTTIIERKNDVTYKYFSILCMFFVTALLVANIASSKLISLFDYTMSGGVLFFLFLILLVT